MIACGSFITWYAGIDGNVLLHPNEPARMVYLDQDVFKLNFPDEGLAVEKRLPYRAFSTTIDASYEGLTLKQYFPYADLQLVWESSNRAPSEVALPSIQHSTQYMLYNENVSEEMLMSLHPEAIQFESSLSMGPLSLHYLPGPLVECFNHTNESKLIIWNSFSRTCTTPEELGIQVQQTSSGNRFLVMKDKESVYSFFPEHSPYPLSADFNSVLREAPVRLFNRALFETEPHLFLFGKSVAYFDREQEKWITSTYDESVSSHISLPWMGLKIALIRHEESLVPKRRPIAVLPIQKNNELIQGRERALEIQAQDQSFWVTNNEPLSLMINGRRVEIYLTKETLTLPFEFVLTEFKMDTDPGTANPASFESFVKLFTSEGAHNHHIFMNNPLKHEGFTFYQASYSQNPNTGLYSSTLSANVDQGRFLKYLGSLFLVLGSAWHYQITKKNKRLTPSSPLIAGLQSSVTDEKPTSGVQS